MRILLILLISISSSWASIEQYSLRDCMLLPITDTIGNSHGFKIYEELENYLKDKKWCNYRPSSDIINVFSKYREKLDSHLQDKNVIKTVADRLKVGTLIRVSLIYDVDKVIVKLDVIGEDGEDLYISEKLGLEQINHGLIITTLKNWLELYESTIPYDGRVLGVLSDQITFRLPKNKVSIIGQEFTVKRLVAKKKHPLLKKIVEWESITVAKGKISNTSSDQGLGSIKVYMTKKKIEVGDWVKLEKPKHNELSDRRFLDHLKKDKFGKLGEVALTFDLSSSTLNTKSTNGSIKVGGFTYGIGLEAEAWMTREYFVIGEFYQRTGTFEKQSGSPQETELNLNSSMVKIGGGYKYLPMGFFYGPQIDFYTGWTKYTYGIDNSAADGFGTLAISGFVLGIKGNIPMQKNLRAFAKGEVIPFPEADDEDNIYGGTKSISSLHFEVGAKYQYMPDIILKGSFEVLNNTAKFKGANSQVAYSDASLKFGGLFTF